MRHLVYSSASGDDDYFQMAELSRESLARTGYAGDYRLIPNVTRNPLFGRTGAYHAIENLAAYDRVLYADVDTLFYRNPATTLLADKPYAAVCLSVENNTIGGCREKSSWHYLTARQRQLYSGWPALNSGVFAFDPKRCHALFEEWMRFDVINTNKEPNDQGALIALLLSQRMDWQYLDHRSVWYRWLCPRPPAPQWPLSEHSVIGHWAGYRAGELARGGRSIVQDMSAHRRAATPDFSI